MAVRLCLFVLIPLAASHVHHGGLPTKVALLDSFLFCSSKESKNALIHPSGTGGDPVGTCDYQEN